MKNLTKLKKERKEFLHWNYTFSKKYLIRKIFKNRN